MQGTLNEIDIRSILQLIELGQRTGELLVEAYNSTSLEDDLATGRSPTSDRQRPYWLVFFVNGQIVYTADRSSNHCRRLRDYLNRYSSEILAQIPVNPATGTSSDPEYTSLWQLIEKKLLTPEQGRSAIKFFVQETLFDLLSLRQGAFIFEMGAALDPLLTTLEIAPLVTYLMQQVQQWKQFHPHLQNPQQCLLIADKAQLRSALPANAFARLSRWSDGKTSLRQLSRYLHRDLVALAHGIYPYVERGWLHLVEAPSSTVAPPKMNWEPETKRQPPHVVCLDDDFSVGKQVESMLERHGYRATLLSDPLQALSRLFELDADLILCDIAMPILDGFEICAMLRHSKAFRQIPIIMLTGKEGFTDRVRARMVGATNYLTKPFGEQELILLLEKYLR